jgi:hypothetical protein
MQNQNTITRTQNKAMFDLGQTVMTIGAKEALKESNELPATFLAKHESGDWGIVGREDRAENEFSLKSGYRLLSAYMTATNEKIWIITEADRSVTTILLPEEY